MHTLNADFPCWTDFPEEQNPSSYDTWQDAGMVSWIRGGPIRGYLPERTLGPRLGSSVWPQSPPTPGLLSLSWGPKSFEPCFGELLFPASYQRH